MVASWAGDDALAAHADGDTAALSAEIARLLGTDDALLHFDSVAEETVAVDVVARVWQHLHGRPICTVYAVAAALVGAESSEESDEKEESVEKEEGADSSCALAGTRTWELLGYMLQYAKQQTNDATVDDAAEDRASTQATLLSMLEAYAARVATELTSEKPTSPDMLKRLVGWADTVVDVAVRVPSKEATGDDAWIVRLAVTFLRVHQHSAAVRNDFRIMTLVWKNLNKLSAVFRAVMLQYGTEEEATGDTHDIAPYSFSAAFEAAASSLARTTQRLRTASKKHADHDITGELKLLRLFLRALQGQFVQFVDAMVAQVECGVALAVDAIAAVVPIAEGLVTDSDKTQHEAVRVLQCVISFVETMARSDKLQASTRSFVGTLLWQPSDNMITLVTQTRSQHVDADDSTGQSSVAFVEWGHVLALATFYAVHGDSEGSPSASESPSSPTSIVPEFTCIAALFARFRAWGSRVLVGEYPKTTALFVDIVLDSLVAHATTTSALQLFLIEQTLQSDPTQRFLLWEFWRELMCFVWEDAMVIAAFNMLVELTYAKNAKREMLQGHVRDDVLNLLAYLYPEVCGPVKQEYLRVVSSAFDVVCAEGPGHKLTPQLASSFDLLELLATSSMLVEYDGPEKEDWIAHYLPVAMECLGGIHDLLDQGQLMTTAERNGVLRVLDAGLLVVRCIFEDNDKADVQSAQGLSDMVLPMCAETITHLAKMVQQSNGDQGSLSPVSSRSFTRVLGNSLEILTTLAHLIKANHRNQCVQVIKDLLTILQFDHELSPHAATITIFIRDALADMWVMPSDADIVWKMLACVFHKLSALHFGLQVDPVTQPLTPAQSVCLEAMYALMVRSNLPDFANRQRNFKSWVVPHAQPRFAKFIQIMCDGAAAAVVAKQANCHQWFQSDQVDGASIVSAQSTENATKTQERERPHTIRKDPPVPPIVSMDDVDMEEAIETAKRIKWDAFAATYWQLHDSLSSLSSPALQEAFLDRLTEKDLDQATVALQALLQKSPII